jgi:hypothetical protein
MSPQTGTFMRDTGRKLLQPRHGPRSHLKLKAIFYVQRTEIYITILVFYVLA